MVYALILAGGIGSRMGADIPKQFIEVNGKAIISYTIRTFARHDRVNKTIVLVPEEWIEYTRNLLDKDLGHDHGIDVIAGGAQRNDTIMNGIHHIEANYQYDDDTILLTHDAVRPFVTDDIIDANIDAMREYSVCDTVIPATDTIVESMDHRTISSVPDRSKLYQGQTPQTFRLESFESLFQSLSEEEKNTLTDAVKVFVLKGESVGLVNGSSFNIKITYPSDINLAESILRG